MHANRNLFLFFIEINNMHRTRHILPIPRTCIWCRCGRCGVSWHRLLCMSSVHKYWCFAGNLAQAPTPAVRWLVRWTVGQLGHVLVDAWPNRLIGDFNLRNFGRQSAIVNRQTMAY